MMKPFEPSSKLFMLMVYKSKGTAISNDCWNGVAGCIKACYKTVTKQPPSEIARAQATWKKDHEIFIGNNKWEIHGICLPDTYSCIDSSTKPCTVMGAVQNSAAGAIYVKKLERNINSLVTG